MPECTRCDRTPINLAAHLCQVHLLGADHAQKEAQAVMQANGVAPRPAVIIDRKELVMPKPMCRGCHRTDGTHTEKCAQQQGCKLCARFAPDKCGHHGGTNRAHHAGVSPAPKAPHPAPPARTSGSSGSIVIPKQYDAAAVLGPQRSAKTSGAAFLADLKAIRAQLDERITAVEQLLELL